ncbi:MAG: sulfatase [Verrucomicrobiota bacterium]
MKKTSLLLSSFIVLLGLTASGVIAEEEKPNVVLFLVDDLGWMDLGCQGSTYYQTPNIDALAESGVRFTDAYAACAVCSPTRAAILTGKYPARLLLTQWLPAGRWNAESHRKREGRFLRSLPLEERTLAEVFREEGYATIHVGKWHLGGAPFSLPEHHGFDENVAGDDHGAPGSYFHPFQGTWTIPTTRLDVKKVTYEGGVEGDYLTDLLTEEAIGRMQKHAGEKPFFLYFPFYNVHTPLQGDPEKVGRYSVIAEKERQGKPSYAAMIESVDEAVGRVMEALEEWGEKDQTLILFTSDNGGFARATNNAPLRANKGSHYEGGIRVPLIISGRGVEEAGEVSHVLATSSDLYPTILDLVGIDPRPQQHLDGVSLAGVLGVGEPPTRKALFWHYPHYNRHPENHPVSIIRYGHWKLMQFLETGDVELYDLANDLGETRNMAEAHEELANELLGKLDAWRAETGAEAMLANPLYQGSR